MASCRTSVVSILNNDDHPSFAVPSTLRSGQPKQHVPMSPLYPYHQQGHQDQQQLQHHQYQLPHLNHLNHYPIYPDSSVHAPRVLRHPYDPIPTSTTSLPTSPVLSDCSHDYAASSRYMPSYHPYSRHDYPYSPPAILPLQNRLSYPAEPPSPQSSLGAASRDLPSASRSSRKNKYPCPYAASHGCTATFTTSGHAARHGKKHTGEKSVHCPICNKAFTRKDNMKQHIRTHRTHSEEMSIPASDGSDDRGMWVTTSSQMYGHHRPMSSSVSQTTNRNSFHSVTGIVSTSRQSTGSHRGRLS